MSNDTLQFGPDALPVVGGAVIIDGVLVEFATFAEALDASLAQGLTAMKVVDTTALGL